ncbi:MAG: 1-(5-phosphoribosyl)-5-[(5-phosphoribosylamino)methylideneamino]imidazole-4-carboxamide isomerase [Syntrophomonadaceae bacterium]|nr:1-(5-phosphoribosyl)-5-[(5-phosphoribosylamino)methylideneamino]imidazole-4-carboxamide isomerase [Syntrophomonadaceae bacterium]
MLVIPAIDLREGRCVRLIQGRLDKEIVFSDNPVEVAIKWEKMGARWLHVVDLDGAFAGSLRNLESIKGILSKVNIPVQVGGGIRTMETVRQLLGMGVNRVILGTTAVAQPDIVRQAVAEFGERIMVGIDGRDGKVVIEGWDKTAEKGILELGREVEALGIQRIVLTDIRRDGMLKGPNVEGTREMGLACNLKIIASGGISSLEDIRSLKALEPYGVEGVIIGRALYSGVVVLEEALAIARAEGPII